MRHIASTHETDAKGAKVSSMRMQVSKAAVTAKSLKSLKSTSAKSLKSLRAASYKSAVN